MKLFEHPDFEQAVLAAEEHFKSRGLSATIIEKDYFVTEALRTIAAHAGDRVIFKGGTSLSKGWNLIERFSEDVDIFFAPGQLRTRALDRELKRLRDIVAEHPGLTPLPDESQTIGGFGRNDRFSYPQRFGGVGAIANRVLLEIGTASGHQPAEHRVLRSYVGEYLAESGKSLGADDEGGFEMALLHFRRTFVEKLFAIHDKVELFKWEGRLLGTYARHYYDIALLAATPEVVTMIGSAEYAAIKHDYDEISRSYFAKNYRPPKAMSFANSDALFPQPELAAALGREYETQCKALCFGTYPHWEEVLSRLGKLRDRL